MQVFLWMTAGSYGKNMVSFISNCQTVFQSEHTIFITISNEWVLSIPHPSQHLVLSVFQIFGHSHWCVVESYFWCNLHFSDDIWYGGYFFFAMCISLLVRCLLRYSIHFIQVSYFLIVEFLSVICIFWMIVLYQLCLLQIFSSYLWLVLSFS